MHRAHVSPPGRVFSLLLVLLLGGPFCRPCRADDTEGRQVYKQTLKSTVVIKTHDALGKTHDALGTGWLANKAERLFVTNHHVVGSAARVEVIFPLFEEGKLVAEREEYRRAKPILGHVLETDPRRDLAIIQLDALPANCRELQLAAESAAPGDTVHSIGNPGKSDAYWIYTKGVVRQVYRKEIRFAGGMLVKARIVESQAPLNPGDSGGPVVNGKGELIGVVSSYRRDAQLISNCIDVREVRGFVERTREVLAEKRAWPSAPLVVRVTSLDVLVPRLRSLTRGFLPKEDSKELEDFLREWIDSDKLDYLDRKRPFAMYLSVARDEKEVGGVVLIPIADEKQAVKALEALGVLEKPDAGGIHKLKSPGDASPKMFLRFAHRYAYLAIENRALISGRDLVDPATILHRQSNRLLSVGLRLNRLPAAMLKDFGKVMKTADDKLGRTMPEKASAPERLAWRLSRVLLSWTDAAVSGGEELWFHTDFDSRADEIALEWSLTGRRGSKLADGIRDFGEARSRFHGVTGANPALRMVVCANLPAEICKSAGAVMDELLPSTDPAAEMLKAKFDFLRSGEVDLFFELQGPGKDDLFTLIHGSRLTDSKRLERAFRKLLAGAPGTEFDVAQIRGFSVHRAKFGLLDPSGDLKHLVGNHPSHFVIIPSVHLEVTGERSLAILRKVMETADMIAGPQMSLECSVGRLADSSLNSDQASRKLAREMFKKGVPDRVQVTLEGGRTLKARMVVNTSVVRFLAKLGEASK